MFFGAMGYSPTEVDECWSDLLRAVGSHEDGKVSMDEFVTHLEDEQRRAEEEKVAKAAEAKAKAKARETAEVSACSAGYAFADAEKKLAMEIKALLVLCVPEAVNPFSQIDLSFYMFNKVTCQCHEVALAKLAVEEAFAGYAADAAKKKLAMKINELFVLCVPEAVNPFSQIDLSENVMNMINEVTLAKLAAEEAFAIAHSLACAEYE